MQTQDTDYGMDGETAAQGKAIVEDRTAEGTKQGPASGEQQTSEGRVGFRLVFCCFSGQNRPHRIWRQEARSLLSFPFLLTSARGRKPSLG